MTDESGSGLIVNNNTDKEIKGDITITSISADTQQVSDSNKSDSHIITDEFTLQPSGSQNDSKEYSDIAGDQETVEIRINIHDGPNGNHRFMGTTGNSSSVFATIHTDQVRFSEGQA